MALLDTLAGELLGPKSVAELSQSTGASADQTKQLVTAALPLLLAGMHQNSATAEGAASLSKALDAHAPDAQKSTSAMLKKADAEDGKKIVKHILGSNEAQVTKGLTKATGMSQDQVTSMLGQLAPVVMSLVGSQAQQQPQQAQSSAGLAGLLGSALLGGGYQQSNQTQQNGLNVASLAGALLGGGSSSGSSAGASLLSGLLGAGTAAQSQQTTSSTSTSKPKKPKTGSSAKPASTSASTSKPKKPKKEEDKPQEEEQQDSGFSLSGLLMGLLK